MSVARKCDVCGKLYEPYKIDYKNNEINGFSLLYRSTTHDDCLTKGKNFDCCEECLKKIINMVNNNKPEKSFEEVMLSRYHKLMDFCTRNNITVTIRNLDMTGFERVCLFKFEHVNWSDKSFSTIISMADIYFPTFTNSVYVINYDIIKSLEQWINSLEGE